MLKRLCGYVLVVAGSVGTAGAQIVAWKANWIEAPWSTVRDGAEADGSRPMPLFRREFTVAKAPKRAAVRIAGLGQYVLTLDGKLVTPEGLHQAWTDYAKTVTYDTWDVSRMLTPGRHVLGVMLGNGMYNAQRTKGRYTKFEGSFGAPKLIAELRMEDARGAVETIGTDASWKAAKGPVTFASTYGGEDEDARLVQAGWDAPGFDDAAWTAAQVAQGPGGELIAAISPDVRVVRAFETPNATPLANGDTVYDFGQNFAGWVKVKLQGPAGAVLKLTPGELLNADGSVSQRSSGGPMWWSYTLRGDAAGEAWAPRFGYYGFRYVEAQWVAGGDAAADGGATRLAGKVLGMEGEELSSASPVAGSFESSDAMLNAIHGLIVNAAHNNEVSLLTDCPHREKLGWLDETHLVSAVMFDNDLHGLYAATAKNIADAQHEDGDVPTIAPQYTVFGKNPRYAMFDDSPEWGSASVLATWAAYRFYGDKTQLEKNYPTMQRYVEYLKGKAGADGIVAFGLGDWYDIGPKPPGVSQDTSLGVTGTLMLYEDAATLGKIARILGRGDDAVRYEALAQHEAAAFERKYWNAEKEWYDTGSQTANAMPLALGIVPQERRAAVLAHVVEDIQAHDDHITTGEVGYPYLVRALMEAGENDLLLQMMLVKTAPSYGSQLAAGATSLTEAWDANVHASQDHFMLGGAEEWFYRGLGGIDFDMTRAEDERITIHPRMVAGLESVKASYDSVLGRISTAWRQGEGTASVDVGIPPGAMATVILPVKFAREHAGLDEVKGKGPKLTEVRRDEAEVVYRVTAGMYHFREAESGAP